MPSGSPIAFTLIRVQRGGPRPTEEQVRRALQRDRERLHQPPPGVPTDCQIAGPYAITVDGAEFDEYVMWER